MKEIIESRIAQLKNYKYVNEGNKDFLDAAIQELEMLLQQIPPTTTLTQLHADLKEIMISAGCNDKLTIEAKVRDSGDMEYWASIRSESSEFNCMCAFNVESLVAKVRAHFITGNTIITV